MKIKIDQQKMKKTRWMFLLLSILFLTISILILSMNLVKEDGFNINKLVPILGTLILGFFCLLPVINLAKRRKFSSEIISLENGSLIIRNQLFSPIKIIELRNIKSIRLWRETKTSKQYLISQTDNNYLNILDYLKGNHFYITNTIVCTKELDNFITELNKRCH